MPGKQGIGRYQRIQFIKYPATKLLGLHGQSYPLFAGEPKPLSFELILQNTVFFDEIITHCLLVTLESASQGDYQEMESL